jgi:dipeptidyl aminopeptidase/acylaminoacyl peptidase
LAVRGLTIGAEGTEPVLLKIPPGNHAHPRASPDGTTVAFARVNGDASDIWTFALSGVATEKRLTQDGHSRSPVWSRDSRRITFQRSGTDGAGVFWRSADGRGDAEQLTKSADGEEHIPDAWSPDGGTLLFSILKGNVYSLHVLTLEGLRIERYGEVSSTEPIGAGFSPDGKWVTYAAADPAGGALSPNRGVFVEPFPPRPGERHSLPKTVIDYHPVWAPDGSRIFYVPGASVPTVAVPVSTTPSLTFGAPVSLPRAPRPELLGVSPRGYDVLPDGRFLSLSSSPGDAGPLGAAGTSGEIRVIVNWFEELKSVGR